MSTSGVRSGHAGMWAVVMILAVAVYGLGLGHEGLWYDEVYSAAMAERTVPEIVRLTTHDVHPPLYYVLLRGFRLVLGGSERALRLLSLVGAVSLVALGAGPIRRMWGDATARLYATITLVTPAVLIYAHEARMYTLLMAAVTAAVAYGWLALRDNRTRDWICLGISSLAAAYLHYYGVLAGVLLYLILGVRILTRRIAVLRPFLLSAGCVVLAYLPWLVFFLRQAMNVRKAFWINPIDPVTVLGAFCVSFSYKDFFPAVPWFVVLATCLTCGLLLFGVFCPRTRRLHEEGAFLLLAILVFDGTLLASIVVSVVFAPVFIPRYMLACTGPVILAMSVSVRLIPIRAFRVAAMILFIALNAPVMKDVYTQRFNGLTREMAGDLREAVQPGDLIVTSDCFAMGPCVHYVRQGRHLFYLNDREVGWRQLFHVFEPRLLDRDRLAESLSSGTSLWIVTSDSWMSVPAERILEDVGDGWKQAGESKTYAHPYSRFAYSVLRLVRAGEDPGTPMAAVTLPQPQGF